MKKVLFLIDHAPNYRESFLRELSHLCHLTVLAHSCERDNLTPPIKRIGYNYIELKQTYGKKLRFNFELPKIIRSIDPDVICVALNPRYPVRIINFLFSISLWSKWIWWGQIFGRSNNFILDKLRLYLLKKSFGTLVYTDDIANKLSGINVVSFNNSQFSSKEFKKLDNIIDNSLKFLFVGRPQKRKNLEYIITLANKNPNFKFRLVGPGMLNYFSDYDIPNNIELFGAAQGENLTNHFKWSNLVLNPGHVGLLVMNAACHCRPIIINSDVNHAPEIILAQESDQFFLNFNSDQDVDLFFSNLSQNKDLIINKGNLLYSNGLKKYTVEMMAKNHMEVFNNV
ncbi:hypothetical protein GCM10027284_02220 [Cyclobacterium sediminis]